MCAFSANVRRRRQALGLTQDELAARLHVTRQAVSGWERGKTQPDLDTLAALAQALDTRPADLLDGGGDAGAGADAGTAMPQAPGGRAWLAPLAQAAAGLALLGLTQALVQGPVRQHIEITFSWFFYQIPCYLFGLLPAYWLLARVLVHLLKLAGLPPLPTVPRRVLRALALCFLAYTLAVAAVLIFADFQSMQAARQYLSFSWTGGAWMTPWFTLLSHIPLHAHGLFGLLGAALAFSERPKKTD